MYLSHFPPHAISKSLKPPFLFNSLSLLSNTWNYFKIKCFHIFVIELKCLQVVLADASQALEEDCKSKLEKRMEMFKNAAVVSSEYAI